MTDLENSMPSNTLPEEVNLPNGHGFYTYNILGTDTDYKDQLQMHSLFSMMQEAAQLSAAEYGWGAEILDKLDTCWLLLRQSVRMDRRPSWMEKITVETWSRGANRLSFFRDFNLYDQNGIKIGSGSSVWVLANKTTHRLARPDALMVVAKRASDPSQALPFDPPKLTPRLNLDKMAAGTDRENSIIKYADFSEIDRNLHVNNTRYVAWCLDAAHKQSLDQGDVVGIDINYNAEIHFGEKVVLFFEEGRQGQFSVDGYVTGGNHVAFSAVLYRNMPNGT